MKLSRRQLMQGAIGLLLPAWAHAGLVTQSGARYFASSSEPATFDFYISTTGTGTASGGGSISDPWPITMLNDATARARYAGKRVGLMGGTYNLRTIMGEPANAGYATNRLLVAGGSSGSPTRIEAVNHPADNSGTFAVIIDGDRANTTASWQMGLMGANGDYVTLDGIKFQGANYRMVNNYAGHSYFTLQNCELYDSIYETLDGGPGQNACAFFSQGQCNNILVRNCKFSVGGAPADGGRFSFLEAYATDDSIFEYLTILGAGTVNSDMSSGNGFYLKGNGPSAGDSRNGKRNTLRYSYINISNLSSPTTVRWTGNTDSDGEERIYGNVLVTGGKEAIWMEDCANVVRVEDNTADGVTNGWSVGGFDRFDQGGDLHFNRNILSRTSRGSRGDLNVSSVGQILSMDYNYFDSDPALRFTTGGGAGTITATSLATLQSATSMNANSLEGSASQFTGTGTDAEAWQTASGATAHTMSSTGGPVGAWGATGLDEYGVGYNWQRR